MSRRTTTRTRTPGRSSAMRRRMMRRRLLALALTGGLAALAAVIVLPMLNKAVKEVTLPLRHEDIIRQQAESKALDPSLIAAVIYAESKFRDSTSATGAKGLMQIQPETARFIADRSGGTEFRTSDLGTPQVNISYGSWYLRYLLRRYDGNETLAIAAYNGGETNVDRWVAASGRSRERFRAAQIPFAETRAYVQRVQQARRDYRRRYSDELGL
jgi:soluble lytic murein transglycosylase